nr:unnamed protein product [Spirometra erinaceieuropaei]
MRGGGEEEDDDDDDDDDGGGGGGVGGGGGGGRLFHYSGDLILVHCPRSLLTNLFGAQVPLSRQFKSRCVSTGCSLRAEHQVA